MLEKGNKVRIINAEKIDENNGYFKNGDIVEITTYEGYLALKHPAKELCGGLVLLPNEEKYVEVV